MKQEKNNKAMLVMAASFKRYLWPPIQEIRGRGWMAVGYLEPQHKARFKVALFLEKGAWLSIETQA